MILPLPERILLTLWVQGYPELLERSPGRCEFIGMALVPCDFLENGPYAKILCDLVEDPLHSDPVKP